MASKEKTIYFVLNTLGLTGGVKVIFEQANLFAQKGYEVHIVHLLRLRTDLKGNLVGILKKIKYFIYKNKRPAWFELNQDIIIHRWFSLNNKKIIGFLIATANETADWVNKVNYNNEKKYYYVLDHELWTRNKDLVEKTYSYPLKKIALSQNIREQIEKKTNCNFIGLAPGGIDYEYFYYEEKKDYKNIKILMLFHPLPKKGFKDGLEAIQKIKKENSNIKLHVFSAYPNPQNLIIDEFHYKPSQKKLKKLYQEANIFLYPALEEGFGLTLLEAAAAKCVLITTKVGWTINFGQNQKDFLLIEKNDPENIINVITELIGDNQKMERIGEAASQLAKNFTWQKSNDNFENLLNL